MKNQRPEIKVLAQITGEDRFFEWAHSIGVATDDKLRSIAPAIPHFAIRRLSGQGITEANFLYSGLTDAKALIEYYRRLANANGPATVLDFGCGCGRVLRFLSQLPDISAFGSDVNPDHVAWCRLALPQTTVKANGPLPPLDYESESFDFVYAYSVFTHLSERAMFAWLDELGRVIKPGGIVLLTTHGEKIIRFIINNENVRRSFRMTTQEVSDLLRQLPSLGFVFRRRDEEQLKRTKVGDDYGVSFMHESYIREHWPRDIFEIVEFIPAGLCERHDIVLDQDIVLMRRL